MQTPQSKGLYKPLFTDSRHYHPKRAQQHSPGAVYLLMSDHRERSVQQSKVIMGDHSPPLQHQSSVDDSDSGSEMLSRKMASEQQLMGGIRLRQQPAIGITTVSDIKEHYEMNESSESSSQVELNLQQLSDCNVSRTSQLSGSIAEQP